MNSTRWNRVLVSFIILGFSLRLALTFAAGDQTLAPWSGGGDTPAYINLSDSLIQGKGFSFAGMPTAFRPPLYPLLLAGAHILVGTRYLLFVRLAQVVAAGLAAWLCARASGRIWGREGACVTLACFALSPTLIFLNSEILTESFAILLTSFFLWSLLGTSQGSRCAGGNLAIAGSLSMLLRFNAIVLPFVAAWRMKQVLRGRQLYKQLAVFALLQIVLLSPWLIRNLIVFRGRVLYSTLSGWGLVLGSYSPQGRADTESYANIRRKLGWVQSDIERNDLWRHRLGSEADLNQQAIRTGLQGWREEGWKIPRLICRKLGDFWLSTDQLVSIGRVPYVQQIFRRTGVLVYWCLLILGVLGLIRLHRIDPALATTFFVYGVACTLLYIPFAMSTRLRVSSIEPMLCILAAGGVVSGRKLPRPDAETPAPAEQHRTIRA